MRWWWRRAAGAGRQAGGHAGTHAVMLERGLIDLLHGHCCCKNLTHLRQMDGECVRAGVRLVFVCVCVCVSVPFVFECVGEVYYMVLESSFCDVVLQTGLYSTCTHSSTESNRCMVEGKHCAAMFVRGRHTRCWFMFI